jgi:hypothetical protein
MAKPLLPDAYATIRTRGLGLAGKDATGIVAQVGISSLGSSIIPVSDVDRVRTLLGYGPLADAVAECLAAGARSVLAVKAEAGTQGASGDVTATKTGEGTVTPSGAANNRYQMVVEILTAGDLNAATFRYSKNGGLTWSGEITVPGAPGAYVIPNTGITVTFANGGGTFDEGDQWEWTTTEPVMSAATCGTAVDALIASTNAFDFIHIVGPSASALWTSVATKMATAEAAHKYTWALCEAAWPADDDTPAEFVAAAQAEAAGFASDYIGVCAEFRYITDALDGALRPRNCAAIFAGWLVAGARVSDSPAWVERGPLPMVMADAALPKDRAYADVAALDTARYITFRQYEDLDGVYVTADRLMSAETSDFRYAYLRRTMNKAARGCRLAVLPHVWGDGDVVGQRAIVTSAKQPLKRMQAAGEIVDLDVQIPAGQDVLGTSEFNIKIRIQPKPKAAWIGMDLGFANPYAA